MENKIQVCDKKNCSQYDNELILVKKGRYKEKMYKTNCKLNDNPSMIQQQLNIKKCEKGN